MNIPKIVTDFIESGEIQDMAASDPKSKGAFATGATWAACRIAELANTNSTTALKYDRKHNIFYCENCNEVIYEGKSSYRNLSLSFVQTKYKYCHNCGRRFKKSSHGENNESNIRYLLFVILLFLQINLVFLLITINFGHLI